MFMWKGTVKFGLLSIEENYVLKKIILLLVGSSGIINR